MRWTFDLDANALFIYLTDEPSAAQVEMSDGVVVDVDTHGQAVAVEVLSPSAGWDLDEIVARFNLDAVARESLAHVRNSPLMNATRSRSHSGTTEIDAQPSGTVANPAASVAA
jgi:uncharacterized protein YuzE